MSSSAETLALPGKPTFSDAIAVTATCVLPSLATLVYFVLFSGEEAMLTAYGISKVLLFSFPVFWVVVKQRRSFDLLRLGRRGLGLGFISGLVILGAHLALN